MQSAKLTDLGTIARLKVEQTHILSTIQNKNETMKSKTQRLALIIEERLKLADNSLAEEGICAYTIEQISTEIGRMFDRLHIPSDHVKNYLVGDDPNGRPYSRFKDPNQQRNVIGDRGSGGRELDEFIGLSTRERELTSQLDTIATGDLDPLYVFLKKIVGRLETVATNRNILLTGHQKREEVRTKPAKPKITELWQAVKWLREEPLAEFQEFVRNYPPPDELSPKWSAGFVEWGMLFKNVVNDKKSLTVGQWITRIKYLVHQSKHGAAVLDEVETQICDNCWDEKNQRDKEGCNSEMLWDFTSPSRWRCGTCGGTRGHKRGLTREQVGDNKAPILTRAEELVNNLPGVYETLDFYMNDRQKAIYSRKTRLAPTLSAEA